MKVVMIGAGYVGLVSGACFADFGHTVTCIDKDATKVARLKEGVMPIYEPGLAALVESNARQGRLFFTTNGADALRQADAVFIAVGTPSRCGDGYADLTHVHSAAEEIAKQIAGFTVVVTKSTVPVGTGDEIEAILRRVNPDIDIAVVSNPEFLREGSAIEDFKRPDRVVVGTQDERARETRARELVALLAERGVLIEAREDDLGHQFRFPDQNVLPYLWLQVAQARAAEPAR